MHKLLVLLTLFSFLLTAQPAQAILLELDEEQIKEAMELGKKGVKLPHSELLKDWRVDLGYGVGSAGIGTPYSIIVVMAKESAERGRELSTTEIRRVISERKGVITFRCTLYGDSIDFARNYTAVLEYGGQTFTSTDSDLGNAEYTKDFPKHPSYKAICNFRFSLGNIDPKAKVVLALTDPKKGKEIRFPFDLAKLK